MTMATRAQTASAQPVAVPDYPADKNFDVGQRRLPLSASGGYGYGYRQCPAHSSRDAADASTPNTAVRQLTSHY